VLATIDLSNSSDLTAVLLALVPMALGGGITAWLSIFVESEKEVRQRTKQIKRDLVERLSVKHAHLLIHSRNYDEDLRGTLRGDGKNETDFVGEYAELVFSGFEKLQQLRARTLTVRLSYWVLYSTIALGVILCLCVSLIGAPKELVLWYIVGGVLVELAVVFVMRRASESLEEYEGLRH